MLGVLVLHWIIVGSLMHLCWIMFSIKTICTIDMYGVLILLAGALTGVACGSVVLIVVNVSGDT